jgi:ABC-2 type transport system permease protein
VLRRIVLHECRELWRDRRLQLAALVILALTIAAVGASWLDVRRLDAAQMSAQAATRRQWDTQDDKNPHSAAHFGTYAFKPQSPLAFLDRGVDAYVGVAVWIEAHKQNPFLFQPASDGTSLVRFGDLTAAALAGDIVPVLIIILASPLVARERENGLLRQLLAAGASPVRLVAGKALAIWLLTMLLAAVPLGAITIAIVSRGVGGDVVGRWLVWCLVHFSLWWVVAAAATTISALAPNARQAMVASLGVWLLVSIVVPKAAGAVADRRWPLPDGTTFWAATQRDAANGIDGHNPSDQRTEALRQQVLQQYGVSRVEDLPIGFAGLALQAGEEHTNAVFDLHYGRLWADIDKQVRFMDIAGSVSPRWPASRLSQAMAGTDLLDHRRFATEAESYRRTLNRHMNLTMAYRSTGTSTFIGDQDFWRQTPAFAPTARSWSEAAAAERRSIVALAIWLAAATAALGIAGRRLRVA